MTATSDRLLRDAEILLVEDNPGDVFLVEECLRDLSMAVRLHVARDAAQAMGFFERVERSAIVTPALVLLDLHLPLVGGLELLTWIRSRPCFVSLDVVVLTCSDSQSDVARSREIGISEYVIKPFDLSELPRITRMLERHLAASTRPAARQ